MYSTIEMATYILLLFLKKFRWHRFGWSKIIVVFLTHTFYAGFYQKHIQIISSKIAHYSSAIGFVYFAISFCSYADLQGYNAII